MKTGKLYRIIAGAVLLASSIVVAQADKNINWRAEHRRNVVESQNVDIDSYRGLKATGADPKAVYDIKVDAPGSYSLRVKFNPIAGRAVKITLNGTVLAPSALDSKSGSDSVLDCEQAAKWKTLGDVSLVAGTNKLVLEQVDAKTPLSHVCRFELTAK